MLEKYKNIGSALFEKFAHQKKSRFAALSLVHQNFVGFIVISRIVFNISKRFLSRALILCESCRTKNFFIKNNKNDSRPERTSFYIIL